MDILYENILFSENKNSIPEIPATITNIIDIKVITDSILSCFITDDMNMKIDNPKIRKPTII